MTDSRADSLTEYPRPLVSVVMPVRDQERVLRQTLETVHAQSLHNFDLLLDMASALEATGADACVCEADVFYGNGRMKPRVRFSRYKEFLAINGITAKPRTRITSPTHR